MLSYNTREIVSLREQIVALLPASFGAGLHTQRVFLLVFSVGENLRDYISQYQRDCILLVDKV